jgi:hypothetical protein
MSSLPATRFQQNDHRLPYIAAAIGSGGIGALLLGATVINGWLLWEPKDVFALQTGGAAFLAFAVALVMEATANHPTRILLASAVGASAGTALGGALGLLGPTGGKLGLAAMVAGGGIAVILAYFLLRYPIPLRDRGTQISRWFTYFLVWGSVASALFAFGGLILGGAFGKLFGFAGIYDLLYRLDGGVTLGIFVGSVLAVRSRSWPEVRPLVIVGFITNVGTVLGGLFDAASGGGSVGLYLIMAAGLFNAIGLGLGLVRSGK